MPFLVDTQFAIDRKIPSQFIGTWTFLHGGRTQGFFPTRDEAEKEIGKLVRSR